MYRRACLLLVVLLFPLTAYGAGSGFPAQSLWLSDSDPSVGERIQIFAILYNGTDEALSGTVTFLVDTRMHESKTVALKASESRIISSSWTAAGGEHAFSARFAIDGQDAEAAQVSSIASAKVSTPPSQVQQTITEAKDIGTKLASTSLPLVSKVGKTIFDTTESMRNAGIAYLEGKSGRKPQVLGTTTTNVSGFESAEGEEPANRSFMQTASAAILVMFRSMWLFYPIFVGFLLLIFRWLYKWVTKPRF